MKILILLLLAAPAFAQVRYEYTGAPLTISITGTEGGQPIVTNLSGFVDLPQALAPNQANQVVTPVDYFFNTTIAGSGDLAPEVWVFSTANGVITDWYVAINLNDGVKVFSSGGGDYYIGPTYTGTCSHFQNCQIVTETNLTAGTWSLKGDDPPPSLQAQLTHITSEMLFYRNGVVNWEAQALAWQAMAYKCKANKGVC